MPHFLATQPTSAVPSAWNDAAHTPASCVPSPWLALSFLLYDQTPSFGPSLRFCLCSILCTLSCGIFHASFKCLLIFISAPWNLGFVERQASCLVYQLSQGSETRQQGSWCTEFSTASLGKLTGHLLYKKFLNKNSTISFNITKQVTQRK